MAPHVQTRFLLFGTPDVFKSDYVAPEESLRHPGPHTTAFLDNITDVIRNEIETLDALERVRIPTFHTLKDLIRKGRESGMDHPAVLAALVTVESFARYANYLEATEKELATVDRIVTGTGMGVFAAAGATCAVKVQDIVDAGIAAVLAAFRASAHSHRCAGNLTAGRNSGLASALFSGSTCDRIQELIDEYYGSETRHVPVHTRVYVSKISSRGVTVTGPAAGLETFCQAVSSTSIEAPSSSSSVATICMGPLHDTPRLDGIIDGGCFDISTVFRKLPAPAPGTLLMANGKSCELQDGSHVFTEVARQALFGVEDEARAIEACKQTVVDKSLREVWVQSFGPTPMTRTLVETIFQSTSHAKLNVLPSLQFIRDEHAENPRGSSDALFLSVGGDDIAECQETTAALYSTPATATPGPTRGMIAANLGRPRQAVQTKLAIVGMSGRFPDAASHEHLWKILCQGVDTHRVVPADRFPVESHYDVSGRAVNTSHTPYGCWIEKPGDFDPRFFNMSPREAFQTDPMQRMAITTAYEALEMSGYVPNRTPSTRLDRIGTFYGQTSDDWREVNAAQEVDTYFITGGVRAFGPGRINYHFGFSGPSFNVDTACSSSAAALHVACASLLAQECDTAVVGGLSCMTNSDIFAGLSRGQFLSKTGGCKTFDNGADGYCRADGCATVVVKRLDDALADGDNVLAVILGTLTNHSADAISITHPHGPTQSTLSRMVLDVAGVDALDVDYVEMHGTGTQAGDGTEMGSVTEVFAPRDRLRAKDQPLFLGSVKANVGHGEAASGVTALCKVLMMLKYNLIPPHVGIKSEINKTFPTDLSERNVNIAFDLTPFPRRGSQPRRIFVNNFSAAGGNTGLLLEDGPLKESTKLSTRGTHMIAVTAKSKASLMRNAKQLVDWIDDQGHDISLVHLAYTTTARRIQHFWRINVAASTMVEAARAIEKRLEQPVAPIPSEPPKVAFLMTGQGSHYPRMALTLHRQFPLFARLVEEMHELAVEMLGLPGFREFLLDHEGADFEGTSPVVVQLGLCAFEIALARLWQSLGIKPSVIMGHSLGEYAALHVGGVLSLVDTLYLVGRRAQLLVEKCKAGSHAMLAISTSADKVADIVGSDLMAKCPIACVNGPQQTVLAGEASNIALVAKDLAAKNMKTTVLQVQFAFHSAQVDVILDEFEQLASGVEFHTPSVPIVSPMLGMLLSANEPINGEYLRRHARQAVNFHAGLLAALQAGVVDSSTVYLEIGPHPVCCGFVKSTFGSSSTLAPSLRRNEAAFKTLTSSLCQMHAAGLNIDWNEYHAGDRLSVRMLELPAYSFDNKDYWLQYTGDWLLTKNRKPAAIMGDFRDETGSKAAAKVPLSTTSVHSVVSEKVEPGSNGVVVVETETNLSRPDTRPIVEGHLCNGAPLCPSTLYADIAMTVADYAYRLANPAMTPGQVGVNVCDMNMPKTLIFDDKLPAHVLRCKITARPSANSADVVFVTGEGARQTEHASCKIVYGDKAAWAAELNRSAYLIQGRIDSLLEGKQNGSSNTVGKGLAYKLFSALVDYDARYRGMSEVVFDSSKCEASARVVLPPTDDGVEFMCCPFWLDSCCHISGFVINGTDGVDSREQVFVSHGWGSVRVVEKLDGQKEYRSYVRMQPLPNSKMMSGDVYVFDEGGNVVCLAGDVRFQSIPRKVLNTVLPPRGAAAAGGGSAGAASKKMTAKSLAPAASQQSSATTTAAAAATTQASASSRPAGSVVEAVMSILEKEIGCSRDEFADNMLFADLGVDSLMALSISGRMREELDVDIDSHAFIDYPTVGTFKPFLAQFEKEPSSTALPGATAAATPASTPNPSSAVASATPAATSGASGSVLASVLGILEKEIGCSQEELADNMLFSDLGVDSLMALTVCGRVREELELDIDSHAFIDHATIGAFKSFLRQFEPSSSEGTAGQTGGNSLSGAPPHVGSSIWSSSSAGEMTPPSTRRNTPPTVSGTPGLSPADVARSASSSASGLRGAVPTVAVSVCSDSSSGTIRPRRHARKMINTYATNTTTTYVKPPRPTHIPDEYPHRKARAVLLQGSSSCPRKLWMIPDGSGSATSYTEIGRLHADWAVWGLFSPFMLTPHEYKCGVYGIATKFIEEIVKRQPEGPYSMAGWSAGGIIGFEIVQQMTRAGLRVDHLVLIDSPCPITIEPLPNTLHEWFAETGVLGEGDPSIREAGKKIPEWLLPHFAASVQALSNYSADPIPKSLCPRVVGTIWCEKGVCSLPSDPRPSPYPGGHALFLLEDKHDLGPNRWDEYLDEDRMVCLHVPGNHFSMMHGPIAKQLGDHLRDLILM